jgi:IclR family transcriptional regulator, KDG regulon repressor
MMSQRTIQSIDRAAAILDLLASLPDGLGLSDLAQQLDLKAQTAQSLLRTLESHGFVVQGGHGAPYRLGGAVHELSRRWQEKLDKPLAARRAVLDLSASINEYALLAELRGGILVCLVEVRADQMLMIGSEYMNRAPLHVMSTGKLLLAHLDAREFERILPTLDLTRRGPNSVTDASMLREHLAHIRELGYAECVEENSAGTVALAVPIHDATGQVSATLGTSLPKLRYSATRKKSLLKALRSTASRIEQSWTGS